MKRLIFRATRGKAIMHTFPIELAPDEVIRGDDFHVTKTGYVVIFEDGDKMRRTIERVTGSFMGMVFETTIQTV